MNLNLTVDVTGLKEKSKSKNDWTIQEEIVVRLLLANQWTRKKIAEALRVVYPKDVGRTYNSVCYCIDRRIAEKTLAQRYDVDNEAIDKAKEEVVAKLQEQYK